MSDEMKIAPAEVAERRIGAWVLETGVKPLEADWVSVSFELKRLRRELAERDAALARCVEAIKTAMSFIRLHHWNDNAPGRGVWDLDAAGSAYDSLKGATSTLPASAQATAKVLAAARLHYERSNCTDHGPGGIVKQCRCLVCEAIREEKEGK